MLSRLSICPLHFLLLLPFPPSDDVTLSKGQRPADRWRRGWFIRNRQVFVKDFSLPLPPPLTNSTTGCGLGQPLYFISSSPPHPFFTHLCALSSLCLLFHFCNPFLYTLFLPPFTLSWPHSSSDCYDCSEFFCHGLQEEWVSTCQRAQVCTVDTGWLVLRLLEREADTLSAARAAR